MPSAKLLAAWRRLVERARGVVARSPGSSPHRPLVVADFRAMDDAVARRRCRCGARVRSEAEAPTRWPSVRVALLVCVRCARRQRLFLELQSS